GSHCHATAAVCDACHMPWIPELFSAPVLEDVLARRREERLVAVPFMDGLLAGEPEALVASFAGEPEVHHPVRGRIKGRRAFVAYANHMNSWLRERNVAGQKLEHLITQPPRVQEVPRHLDG